MNREEKQKRYEELEKQAIDNLVEIQMDLHGMTSIAIDYLDEDELAEYLELEKELDN